MKLGRLARSAAYFQACRAVEEFCRSGDQDRNRLVELYATVIARWIGDGSPIPCQSLKMVNQAIRQAFGEDAVDITKRMAWAMVRSTEGVKPPKT